MWRRYNGLVWIYPQWDPQGGNNLLMSSKPPQFRCDSKRKFMLRCFWLNQSDKGTDIGCWLLDRSVTFSASCFSNKVHLSRPRVSYFGKRCCIVKCSIQLHECITDLNYILLLTQLGLPHLSNEWVFEAVTANFQLQNMNTGRIKNLSSGRRREHDLTSSLLTGRVIRSVWQPTFIVLQCNHQEMSGKCLNLHILIWNARTLYQAFQRKYYSCFFGLASAVLS